MSILKSQKLSSYLLIDELIHLEIDLCHILCDSVTLLFMRSCDTRVSEITRQSALMGMYFSCSLSGKTHT